MCSKETQTTRQQQRQAVNSAIRKSLAAAEQVSVTGSEMWWRWLPVVSGT